MKQKKMVLTGVMIMISIFGFGQIQVKNESGTKIKVVSTDKLNSVEIGPKEVALVPFLKDNSGTVNANFSHSTYKPGLGFTFVEDGNFTLNVVNEQVTFAGPKQKQAIIGASVTAKAGKRSSFPAEIISVETGKKPSQTETTSNRTWFSSATFAVQNLCTKTIIGYSGDFLGLCLKPKDTAGRKVTHATGNLQAAFGYDEDIDSIATGKNRKWAVLDKAVTEGMDTLKIYNSNLVLANTGVMVSKTFHNRTNLGYLIMNDNFTTGRISSSGNGKKVKTISPGSSQRINFYLGWNVMSLQYKDEQGYPKQAVLLFLVTEGQGAVNLSQKNGTGASISEKELKIE